MSRRIVDPSVSLRADIRSDPPGHEAGREIGYCQPEKLANLEALPDAGFTVSCFPVKVHRGPAGWTRAVALLD